MSGEVTETGLETDGGEPEVDDTTVEVDDGGEETETEEETDPDEESEESQDDDEGSEADDEDVEDEEESEDEEEGQKSYKEEFKKHPELRKAFFEHKQYSQIFSSPAEAAEAYEEVQTFRDLTGAVDAGDINPVIQSVIEANPKAFEKFSVEFIGNIQGYDVELYKKVVAPEFSNLFKRAAASARQAGNKSLFLAAQHMSNYVFGTENPPEFPKTQPTQTNDGNHKDIQTRSAEFYSELRDEVDSFFASEAERNLDPNNVLPKALKNSVKSEIIQDAVAIIKKDVGAQNKLKVLRDKAARAGFNYESRKNIRDAYITMMKPIIARMRTAKRVEAMKAIGKSVEVKNKTKKKVLPSGSRGNTTNRPVDAKEVDWSKTSPRDAIDGKYTMKAQSK